MATLARQATGRVRRLNGLLWRTSTLLLRHPAHEFGTGTELAGVPKDTLLAQPHPRRTVHNATATSTHARASTHGPSAGISQTAPLRGASSSSTAGTAEESQEHGRSEGARHQAGSERCQAGSDRRQAGSLKDALRALYKRVHPDLFHSHPHQQAVNQRSFQLLQDYLVTANASSPQSPHSGASALGAAGTAYAFEFYLWQTREEEGVTETTEGMDDEGGRGDKVEEGKRGPANPGERGGHASEDLNTSKESMGAPSGESLFTHVRITLPRPQRGFSPLSSSLPGLSLPTRAALSRLLIACGVDADVDWHSGAGEEAGTGEGSGALGRGKGSLSALFQYAAELQQRASTGASTSTSSSFPGVSEFDEPGEPGGGAGIGTGGFGHAEVELGGGGTFRDGVRQEVVLRSALRRAHGVSVRFAGPPNTQAEEQARDPASAHREGTRERGKNRDTESGSNGDGQRVGSQKTALPALAQRLGALQSLVKLLDTHRRYALAMRGSSVLLGAPQGGVDHKGNLELPGLGLDGGSKWLHWLQEQDRVRVQDPESGSVGKLEDGAEGHPKDSVLMSQKVSSVAQRFGSVVRHAGSPLAQELRGKRGLAQRRQWAERVAAEEMEVDMVFADPATSAKEEYMGLLLRLIEWAEEQGSVGQGRFADLPLRVFCPHEASDLRPPTASHLLWPETRPGSALQSGGADLEGASGPRLGRTWSAPFAVHMGMGYVAVPLAAEPKEVYSFISAFGHRALEAKRMKRERDEAMAQLLQQCRAQLRLRRLAVDWARVEPDQAQAAMIRLLRSSQALAPLTEGVSLCLSNRTCLPYERTRSTVGMYEESDAFREYLHLEWNFDLSSL